MRTRLKLGEKILFGFSALVIVMAAVRGYQVITREEPSMPKHYYEWDEVGLQGHYVYREMGCNSCHKAMGVGEAGVAPVLDGVGTRRTEEWLQQYLTNPGQLVPGTAHDGSLGPDFRTLQMDERKLLTAYLFGLKANPNSPNYPVRPPTSN